MGMVNVAGSTRLLLTKILPHQLMHRQVNTASSCHHTQSRQPRNLQQDDFVCSIHICLVVSRCCLCVVALARSLFALFVWCVSFHSQVPMPPPAATSNDAQSDKQAASKQRTSDKHTTSHRVTEPAAGHACCRCHGYCVAFLRLINRIRV